MSAIAAKANGNFAMMSILSFPVVMPLILVVIRLSKQAVDGLEWAGVGFDFISILVALNVLTLALSFLLFPYLWRD
jgi:heme exporter protein B